VKLFFDENLSFRRVELLADEYPASSHPDIAQMRGASDDAIWKLARDHGFVIVSKDVDFRQRAFLEGPPPKVVCLSVGNAAADAVGFCAR
jgi:predicted nuclease of predicted toxin-antitoxin system